MHATLRSGSPQGFHQTNIPSHETLFTFRNGRSQGGFSVVHVPNSTNITVRFVSCVSFLLPGRSSIAPFRDADGGFLSCMQSRTTQSETNIQLAIVPARRLPICFDSPERTKALLHQENSRAARKGSPPTLACKAMQHGLWLNRRVFVGVSNMDVAIYKTVFPRKQRITRTRE